MDPITKKNFDMWLESDLPHETKDHLLETLKRHPDKIIDAFYTRLSFGTGGMRGLMGEGTNRINKFTIQMATQSLANYLHKRKSTPPTISVFIGYDSRNRSQEFALEAAKVLAANNIHVFLCAELRPTPFVSFGCREKGCQAAIMITASHNPPEYNGYKVYWEDGGQVVPPHDQGIINEFLALKDFSSINSIDSETHPLIELVGEDLDEKYLKCISKKQFYPEENRLHGNELCIAYSSLHGTGITLVPKALNEWGFHNIHLVKSQQEPDGTFRTVKVPNPEERAALEEGIKTMNKHHCDLLIATDPDADRVGVAVRHDNEPVLINGNQMACLCLYHICEALTNQNRMPPNAAFVKTIATTELFRVIAETYGGKCFDVLTGFKYIAEKILEWEKSGNPYQYIFGGEESYGYLLGTHSRDKDAVISSALICEVALHAKRAGKTLVDLLREIYKKYGVYREKLLSIHFDESKASKELMQKKMKEILLTPPKTIAGIRIKKIEDYQKSVQRDLKTGKTINLTLPKSNVLLFWLEDKSKVLIRPSGTEPKIKLYCGVTCSSGEHVQNTIKFADERIDDILSNVKTLLSN